MHSAASPQPPRRTIADAAGGAFTERTRRKGSGLFSSGHAAVEGIGSEMALVSVQDDRDAPFRIAIDVEELDTRDRLRVECQCAYFTAGHPCEHVFAALLALEAGGEAARLVGPRAVERRLDVVPHRTGLPLGEDNFFDGEHAFSRTDNGRVSPNRVDWRSRLDTLKRAAVSSSGPTRGAVDGLELVLDAGRSETAGAPVITAFARGDDGRAGPVALSRRDLERVEDVGLRTAVEPWLACPPLGQRTGADAIAPDPGQVAADTRRVPTGLQRALFNSLSGRLKLGNEGPVLELDTGPAWQLRLRVLRGEEHLQIEGRLVRDPSESRPLSAAHLLLRDGWAVMNDKLASFDPGPSYDWVRNLRREGPVDADGATIEELLRTLAAMPALPPLELEGDLEGWGVRRLSPIPSLSIGGVDARLRRARTHLAFLYGAVEIERTRADAALVDPDERIIILRDANAERRWLRRLLSSGLETEDELGLVAKGGAISELELSLVELGAKVEREGTRLRRAEESTLRLTSGVDWFELEGEVDFEGTSVDLGVVLDALKSRSDRVTLPDGTEGVIGPTEARRLRALAGLGQARHGRIRFARSQAILLEALVSSGGRVQRDEEFRRVVAELQGDLTITSSEEPAGFKGELRTYQKFGLGWLQVLRRLGLGGCLADDMGLGKTVQVLALLSSVKNDTIAAGARLRPTLVVAPRSLVFNWRQEAERFTPNLRVVEYTGQQRTTQLEGIHESDVILTTYGTLRRDVDLLAGLEFDYVILDEAQTIKNHAAQVSKASRALTARHRLALSGTPVENDVSELWSIFEFLNPRMLGSRRDFVRMAQGDALPLVARGLSPLLLRRRKEDVLRELPEKTELTVYCDLRPEERRAYDVLRRRYRDEIDSKAAKSGAASLRTDVLEALLRLRQIACHPGLIDEKKRNQSSTKLEALVAHLEEVVAEGHKALVFSQFVKLLDIVRGRLDGQKLPYAYLDGQVRDRAQVVDRFQNDPECRVFLISLRAGGLGLNLTAADYVFILDPWWNPAVEAQAIDRAHRIGQTRPVFAYRYIARDTVEEKILALHRDKRALAEAIMGGDGAQSGKLSLDELRLLLQ